MKKIFGAGSGEKGHSKAAGEPERSSAGRIAVVDQLFSSAVSVGASSFAITDHQWAFDPEEELTVEQTGTGWIFTISDHAWGYDFQVYTQEGSGYLQHDHLLMDADRDPESQKSGSLMSWTKQEDGTYKLVHGGSKPLNEGRLERFE